MAISERDFYEAKAGVQQNTTEINNLKTRVADVEKKQ